MLAAAVVALSHLVVLIALLGQRMPVTPISWDEQAAIEIVIAPDTQPPPPVFDSDRAATQPAPRVHLELPGFEPDATSRETPSGTDWRAAGERTAAAVAAADGSSERQFGLTPHPPEKPRTATPFGWDKTHTQRVEALPQGGIRIRLSDRCDLTLAPFPFAGCSLGKTPARGDLFDGMTAPAELGDWQDPAAAPRD